MERLCRILKVDPDAEFTVVTASQTKVRLPYPAKTVREAFAYHLDISVREASLSVLLILLGLPKEEFSQQYWWLSDVLEAKKDTATVNLATLLTGLPKLHPRLYSISSSSVVTPNTIQVELVPGILHSSDSITP